MSVNEFTEVLSSTGLDDETGPVGVVCPRTLLGLTCIVNEYKCLCESVDSCEYQTTKGRNGQVSIVSLTLNLNLGMSNPYEVMQGINLTGYKADFEASREAVRASFNLGRPQNTELKAHVAESGI